MNEGATCTLTVRSRRFLRASRLLLALFVFAGLAVADGIIATGQDFSRGESLMLSLNDPSAHPGGTPTLTYVQFAGVVPISVIEGSNTYARDTMCVDLFTDIQIGVEYNTVVLGPWMVPNRHLEQVSWLIDNALLPAQRQGVSSALPGSDWVTTPAQGAGLQLAIWDLTEDGGNGPDAGNVRQSSDPTNPTEAGALQWWVAYEGLLNASTLSTDSFVYLNTGIGSGTPAQMLEGPKFDTGPGQIPEPATFLLAGGALLGLGWSRRRLIGRKPGPGRG